MVDILVDNNVTNIVITPTQFGAVLTAPNSSKLRSWKQLRNLILGGEIVPHHLVRDFYGLGLPNASVWNLYGKFRLQHISTKTRLPLGCAC